MGQQQLLLLVLGIIVVGVAVALGVAAYNAAERQQQEAMMAQTAGQIATDAHLWASMPSSLGGGNTGPGAETYQDLEWSQIGRSAGPSGFYQDQIAYWELRPDGRTLVIDGCSPNRGLRVVLTAQLTREGQRTETSIDAESDCTRPGD